MIKKNIPTNHEVVDFAEAGPLQDLNERQSEILVVDDNSNNLKLLRTLLAGKNFKVRVAMSGEMALKSVESNLPDLILLDVNMPGMDGFETCEQLRTDSRSNQVPVIFLSALKEELDIVRGFSAGGVDFVTKPFKPEVLLARINTHLTINHLQNNLKNINQELENRVEKRTRQIKEINENLEKEIEERIKTQEELFESEELHRLTLANLDDTVIIITNKDDEYTYISPSIQTVFGLSSKEAKEYDISKLLGISFIDKDIPKINNQLQLFETEIVNKDNETRNLLITIKNALIRDEVTIYTCRDITQRKCTELDLKKSEARLKNALAASNEGIWEWDIQNNQAYFNDTYFTMLDYAVDELPHEPNTFFELLHPDDKERAQIKIDNYLKQKEPEFKLEFRLKNKAGGYNWILSNGMAVEKDSDGNPMKMVGTHTDITSKKNNEEYLRQLASYDTLTNLPNRNYFTDLLHGAILRGSRRNQRHAVLFLDLDRFKNINDSLGHTAGDNLLAQAAKRLSFIVRGDDTVARLGGDEFIILLEDITGAYHAAEIANRVIEILNDPFDILGHQVVISPSIGIVLYPDHGSSPEDLLKNADAAMYHAKQNGGNNYWFFTDDMNEMAHKRLELEEAMRNAINRNEFILHYQPKASLKTGNVVGMEGLVRWNRNGNGLVSPAEFIPIAEETGLIIPIGELVMRKAMEEAKQCNGNNSSKHKIAVNISARQFRQQDFVDMILDLLHESGLDPKLLELEITEAAVMDNTEKAIETMKTIKRQGISLAMDDFGTGYSSLSYLKEFPIDTLKIDMSFIKDMSHSETNKNIVKSIIDLAHNLNLEVVAEGVEEFHQAETLKSMLCDTMQGYLFSKPLACSEIKMILENGKNLYQTSDNLVN